jgi:hypothetical protein
VDDPSQIRVQKMVYRYRRLQGVKAADQKMTDLATVKA